jgi:hypothetical protein
LGAFSFRPYPVSFWRLQKEMGQEGVQVLPAPNFCAAKTTEYKKCRLFSLHKSF